MKSTDKISDFPNEYNSLVQRVQKLEEQMELLKTKSIEMEIKK